MKKIYGLLILCIFNLAVILLCGQFFSYESIDLYAKLFIAIVVAFIILQIDLKVFKILSLRVKSKLPEKKKKQMLKRIRRKKRLTNCLITLLCLIVGLADYYYYRTNQMLETITYAMEPTEVHGYLIVLKDSTISSLNGLDFIHLGLDQEEQKNIGSLLIEQLEKKYDWNYYQDYTTETVQPRNDLFQKLKKSEVDAILIGDETLASLNKSYPNFESETKCIETLTAKTGVQSLPVNVKEEAFNVLIMGVDIRQDEGDIYSRTRTDTLMVASFNPQTMKATLVSIPRDSYVELANSTHSQDKITHAGIEGIGCTIETVENLLDIDINYYAKFNFQALVRLVDTLGGIDVDVQYSFTEQNSNDQADAIHVEKGQQILDGEQALAYARHRNTQNDHVRNASQQQILKAILSKIASFETITKVDNLLNVMKGNMTTNLSRDELISLAGLIPKLSSLEISNSVLAGEDTQAYVPRYDEVLWITDLDADSIEKAHQEIENIFKRNLSHTLD